jgi:hypothetical protein
MSKQATKPKTNNWPRVVIDWDEYGRHTIYADDGVEVIDCNVHTPEDVLYRYSPGAIPEGWLDGPIGYLGDGSFAEECAKAFLRAEAEGTFRPTRKPVRRH